GPGRAVYQARDADLRVDPRSPHAHAGGSGSIRLALCGLSGSSRYDAPVVLPSTLDPWGDTRGLEVVPVFAALPLPTVPRRADRPPDWASLVSSAERHDAPHEAHREQMT